VEWAKRLRRKAGTLTIRRIGIKSAETVKNQKKLRRGGPSRAQDPWRTRDDYGRRVGLLEVERTGVVEVRAKLQGDVGVCREKVIARTLDRLFDEEGRKFRTHRVANPIEKKSWEPGLRRRYIGGGKDQLGGKKSGGGHQSSLPMEGSGAWSATSKGEVGGTWGGEENSQEIYGERGNQSWEKKGPMVPAK